MAKKKGPHTPKCGNCKKPGHYAKRCMVDPAEMKALQQ